MARRKTQRSTADTANNNNTSSDTALDTSGAPDNEALQFDDDQDDNQGDQQTQQTQIDNETGTGDDEGPTHTVNEDYAVVDMDVRLIKPNPMRTPSEEAIAEMAKSIAAVGLQNPIVVGHDYVIVSGNTRYAAACKLGHATIPARFAYDRKGNAISSGQAAAVAATIAENLARRDLLPHELGKTYAEAISSGAYSSASELARSIGVSVASVTAYTNLASKATPMMIKMLSDGVLAPTAALRLAAKYDGEALDAVLAELMAAADGKRIGVAAADNRAVVDRRTQSDRPRRTATEGKRLGRRPSVAVLSDDALKTATTGITGRIRREQPIEDGGLGGYTVSLTVTVHHPDETFARFNPAKVVQAAFAMLPTKDIVAELEAARQSLVS
jgi:ParB/RepB/Spo0J family partition protein